MSDLQWHNLTTSEVLNAVRQYLDKRDKPVQRFQYDDAEGYNVNGVPVIRIAFARDGR